jgi:hypothetical protein
MLPADKQVTELHLHDRGIAAGFVVLGLQHDHGIAADHHDVADAEFLCGLHIKKLSCTKM